MTIICKKCKWKVEKTLQEWKEINEEKKQQSFKVLTSVEANNEKFKRPVYILAIGEFIIA